MGLKLLVYVASRFLCRYAKVLADSQTELYDRYIAMFTLCNLQAARELAAVLTAY
jgi:hypothetical protein